MQGKHPYTQIFGKDNTVHRCWVGDYSSEEVMDHTEMKAALIVSSRRAGETGQHV